MVISNFVLGCLMTDLRTQMLYGTCDNRLRVFLKQRQTDDLMRVLINRVKEDSESNFHPDGTITHLVNVLDISFRYMIATCVPNPKYQVSARQSLMFFSAGLENTNFKYLQMLQTFQEEGIGILVQGGPTDQFVLHAVPL